MVNRNNHDVPFCQDTGIFKGFLKWKTKNICRITMTPYYVKRRKHAISESLFLKKINKFKVS